MDKTIPFSKNQEKTTISKCEHFPIKFNFELNDIFMLFYMICQFLRIWTIDEHFIFKLSYPKDLFQLLMLHLFFGLLKSSTIIGFLIQHKLTTSEILGFERILKTKSMEGGRVSVNEIKTKRQNEGIQIFKEKNFYRLIFFIFISSLIHFSFNFLLPTYLPFIDYTLCWVYKDDVKYMFLIAISLLSLFLFKQKIYQHNILAIIIYIIASIFFYVFHYESYFIYYDKYKVYAFPLFFEIFLSLSFILEKSLIEKEFLSIFVILSFEGMFQLFISIFIILICLLRKEINNNDNIIKISFDNFFTFSLIKNIFFYNIVELLRLIVLQNLTVYHFILSEICSNPLYYIIKAIFFYLNISKKESVHLDLIFCDIGFTISLMIYSEMIILNFCKLNKNTKNEIAKRATIDIMKISFVENENMYMTHTTSSESANNLIVGDSDKDDKNSKSFSNSDKEEKDDKDIY